MAKNNDKNNSDRQKFNECSQLIVLFSLKIKFDEQYTVPQKFKLKPMDDYVESGG